jgi:hypothetical protein
MTFSTLQVPIPMSSSMPCTDQPRLLTSRHSTMKKINAFLKIHLASSHEKEKVLNEYYRTQQNCKNLIVY